MSKPNFLFILLIIIDNCNSARILGLFPHPGKSHFDVFQVLMESLAERGHSVTVVSFFPHKDPPNGYKDISLVGLHPIFIHGVSFENFEAQIPDFLIPYANAFQLSAMGLQTCQAVLPSQQIQGLINRRDFDLIIMEQFNTDCFLAIPYKMETPFMAISSCMPLPWLYRRLGLPDSPSIVPSVLFGQTTFMKFTDRVLNTILHLVTSILYYPLFDLPAQRVVQEHIGEVPELAQIARNTSMLLTNTHFSLHQSRPLVPGVVEVGGMHIKKQFQPLPKELEDFINGAEEGVILFSYGSMLNPDSLPEAKVKVFTSVFSTIPQRVIWKFGKDMAVSPNVKLMRWVPQRAILEHPNVKAFIAHGGLLGLSEALHSGTPVLATPMFGDQPSNVRAAVQIQLAVELPYHQITEETLRKALATILKKDFQKRAKKVSTIFRDRPQEPIELATYWVEYIISHGGQHLRPSSVDLNVIQYYMLDVYGVIIIVIATIVKVLQITINKLRKTKIKNE